MAKSKWSTRDRQAYNIGKGARLSKTRKTGILTKILNGKHGASFKAGLKAADKVNDKF